MLNLERKIWVIIGTRPELIKQLPVYYQCIKKFGKKNVVLVNSGQHKNFLNFYSKENQVKFDLILNKLQSTKSLIKNIKKSIKVFYIILKKNKPKLVVVQGATTTAAGCAFAANLAGVTIAHNEAGLRSFDNKNPFPEELNRKLISSVSDLHFAPTKLCMTNLVKEGINKKNIFIVGNPGIDSFFSFLKKKNDNIAKKIIQYAKKNSKKIVLLTAHRREARGKNLDKCFKTLKIFFKKNKDLLLVCPEHPNKFASNSINKYLKKLENFYLTKPLSYLSACKLIINSLFVVTDSGGIQEECSTIGVPVVICRKRTERQEVLKLKIGKLTGFKSADILNALCWAKKKGVNLKSWRFRPYGNGKASIEIANIIKKKLV